MGPRVTLNVSITKKNCSECCIQFAISSFLLWVFGMILRKLELLEKKAERVRETANLSVPTEWKLLVVTEKLDE